MCTLYYACFDDIHGVVGKLDRVLTFLNPMTGETTELQPEHLGWITTHGPVPSRLAQGLLRQLRGHHDHLDVCLGS